MRVLVVGGAGAFGAFYANLFLKHGFKVGILDNNLAEAEKLSSEKGFDLIVSDSDLKAFDIVAVFVPNEVAPSLVKELAPRLSDGTLLVDFCSVKTLMVKALKSLTGTSLELASIHPLHGPRVDSIVGFPIACIVVKEGPNLGLLRNFFEENGAVFFFSNAEEHDKMLSVVQGLTHYAQFVSAAVLKELSPNLKKSMEFASPNYRLFLGLMSRVILQNPELYTRIQLSNPENQKIWSVFSKKAAEFSEVCQKRDFETLQKKIIESAQQFKDQDSFLREGDRAVTSLNYFAESIRRNIGKRFLVENMLTGKFHYGIICSLVDHKLVMTEGEKKTVLSLNNLRLTSKEEMLDWMQQNLEKVHLDYSFFVPIACNKEIVKVCLSQVKECRFKSLDEYKSSKLPQGQKSLTFRASFFKEDDQKKIDKKIKAIIKGLGFLNR